MVLLASELPFLDVPACALKVKALKVTSVLWFFLGEVRVAVLCDHGVQCGLIECPAFDSAGCLDKRSQVSFRNMQPRKPHHCRFFYLGPLVVLFDPVGEVSHPTAELLFGLRSKFRPPRWQVAVLKREGELIQFRTHTDFSLESTL